MCLFECAAYNLSALKLNQVKRKEQPSVTGQITSTTVENNTHKL